MTISTRHALACALLVFAGGAQALDIIEENDPGLRIPTARVSDAQRRADLRFADCLKASGGRMTERCIAIREQGMKMDPAYQPVSAQPAAPPALEPPALQPAAPEPAAAPGAEPATPK